ncbi:hypothetical protein GCM10009772_29690 [Pseudonocardia alni subsp. carboxydivorans]
MLRDGLQTERARPLDLHPVDAQVLLAEGLRVVGVAADDGGLVDVEAAVAGVDAEQRQQREQVDRLPGDGVLRERRVGAPLDRHREGVPATAELLDLLAHRGLRRQPERDRVVGPGAVRVEHDVRVAEPGDVGEQQRGGAVAELRGGGTGGAEVGLGLHLVVDAQELAVPLELGQVVAEGIHQALLL